MLDFPKNGKLSVQRALLLTCGWIVLLTVCTLGQRLPSFRVVVPLLAEGQTLALHFYKNEKIRGAQIYGRMRRYGNGTDIQLRFDGLPRPATVGAGKTVYVVWALAPDGAPLRLAEITRLIEVNSHIPLSSFGLVVTAEADSNVQGPSSEILAELTSVSPQSGATAASVNTGTTAEQRYEALMEEYKAVEGRLDEERRLRELAEKDALGRAAEVKELRQELEAARLKNSPFFRRESGTLLFETDSTSFDPLIGKPTSRSGSEFSTKTDHTQVFLDSPEPRLIPDTQPNFGLGWRYKPAPVNPYERPGGKTVRFGGNSAFSGLSRYHGMTVNPPTTIQDARQAITLMSGSFSALFNPHYYSSQIKSVSDSPMSWLKPPPADDRVFRFPSMETKSSVSKLERFAVLISLTESLTTPEVKTTMTDEATVQNEAGALAVAPLAEIDVVLSASSADFKIEGSNVASIKVPKTGDSPPASFTLIANSFEGTSKNSKIIATLFNKANGRFIARIERPITISDSSAASLKQNIAPTSPAPRASPSVPGGGARTEPDPVKALLKEIEALKETIKERAQISSSPDYEAPDLSVTMYYDIYPGAKENSEIIISSRHNFITTTSRTFSISPDLRKLIDDQFRGFAARSGRAGPLTIGSSRAPIETTALMKGFGEKLYTDFAPEAFKEAFWKLYDRLGDKFKTIQITTDYPNLPWELMRPRRDSASPFLDFLGTTHLVGRLHGKKSGSVTNNQVSKATVAGLTVVAPAYTGANELPAVEKEVSFLKTLTVFDELDGVKRLEGNLEKLQRYLQSAPPHVVHFAGHGTHRLGVEQVPGSAIKLVDGEVSSTVFKGLLQTLSVNRPFFFLNACEVGQSDNFAGFVDGFAPAVLDAGASGYIGALWAIGDNGAERFASIFYKAMADEVAKNGHVRMAELLRRTKAEFANNGDPTFLSYVFYGDPGLQLVVKSKSP